MAETTPILIHGELSRPYRKVYKHLYCGEQTTLGGSVARTFAIDPSFYSTTYCIHCQDYCPIAEFEWLDGERVGQ